MLALPKIIIVAIEGVDVGNANDAKDTVTWTKSRMNTYVLN